MREQNVFDARLFDFDGLALTVGEGGFLEIFDANDALWLRDAVPEDAFVAGMAEVAVEVSGDEIVWGGGGWSGWLCRCG